MMVEQVSFRCENAPDFFGKQMQIMVTAGRGSFFAPWVGPDPNPKAMILACRLPCEMGRFINGLRDLANKLETLNWDEETEDNATSSDTQP